MSSSPVTPGVSSGLAPNSAANRNEALPATRTRQTNGGLRWTITPQFKLLAGGPRDESEGALVEARQGAAKIRTPIEEDEDAP